MKRGYTLLEILIVIAIIGILFTVGYNNFKDYSNQQAILQVVRQIQSDLKVAQENAIAGNKPSSCTGTLNGYQFSAISNRQYRIDILCSGGNIAQKTVSLPSNIIITSTTKNPLIFKTLAQGTNIQTGTNAIINLRQISTNKTKVITIGANGSIQ